ncbi:MAG TPA: hypothetical protein VKB57_01600 [Acidimicrobiales bacterium]|nr:hypothetical protein [Acidimicrobiales bacterium]
MAAPAEDKLEDIGKWLGLLVGGLAGAFSFLGIQGEEVSAILRNQRWEASAIALMLAAALALSIVSLFTGGKRTTRNRALAVGLATLALNPFMVWAISTGRLKANWTHAAAGAVTVVVLGAALVAYLAPWRLAPLKRKTVPLRLVLLLVGVLLIEIAVYSGLRLETRSQFRTTSPQVSASYVTTDVATKVTLSVRAERLRADDDIVLRIETLARTEQSLADQCGAAGDPRGCRSTPCRYLRCQLIAGAQLRPDAFGKIKESYQFPVDPRPTEHVAITAVLCLRDAKVTEIRGCPLAQQRSTILDVQVPEPAAEPAS